MRTIGLLLAPLSLALLSASCGGDSITVPPSAVAVVGERTISKAQLSAALAQARRSYAAQGRDFPAVGTDDYAALRRLAVSVLVEQAELEQEAPRVGVRVDAAQVEARLRRLKEESFGGSEERYRERLRAERMTDAQVRSALRAQLLVQAMREALTANVKVGPKAVERYYRQHLGDYTASPTRVVRHILVARRSTAKVVEHELAAGASFGELARRFSRDSRTRGSGGKVTLVRSRTLPSLDSVAFALTTGTVSQPFRTRFGWEIVQAVSPVRPGRTTPLASVWDGIRRRLLAVRRNEMFDQWLARTKEKYADRTAYAPGFTPTVGS